MRNKVLIIALLLTIFSCQKDEEFEYPIIYTGGVTDISTKGAFFNAKIIDLSNADIIEYGFVWDSQINPTVEKSEKFVIKEAPKNGTISEYISTSLKNGVTYYVRSFIRNRDYITYGKEVSFTSLGSLAPQITDFSPKTGNINDTLIILGKNFSYIPANNKVLVGQFQATVIKANQDTLLIVVPNKLNIQSSDLSVSINNNTTIAPTKFQLIKAVISDFTPKSAPFGSIVTIVGENFKSNKNDLSVSFGNFKTNIKSITNNQIEVYVPLIQLNLEKCRIKVSMNNLADSTNDYFLFELPLIKDFYPKTGNLNDTIIIYGKNFSSVLSDNIVLIGGLQATVIKANPDTLYILVPNKLNIPSSELSVSINKNVGVAPVKFQLKKPTISDFNPKSASFGSTVTIIGENFNSKNIQSVYFDNFKAIIKNIINNQIEVYIPLDLNMGKCQIKVSMNNMTESSSDYFSILLPNINDFNPKAPTFGSIIQIDGSFLDSNKEHTLVYVDKFKAEILDISSTKLTIKMPDSINVRQPSLSLQVNGMIVLVNEKFTMEALELTDFSPQNPITGGTFTVAGKNFSPITSNNLVMIGNVRGKVTNSSISSITVELPKQDNVIYSGRDLTLSVEVINDKKSFSNYLTVNDKWFRLKNSPISINDYGYFPNYSSANCFANSKKAYIGLNKKAEFWEYYPDKDEWTRLSDFEGRILTLSVGFAIDDKIYYGTGYPRLSPVNDWWEYNIATNKWSRKNDFIGDFRLGAVGFQINNTGYIGAGVFYLPLPSISVDGYTDFWKYSSSDDSWTKVSDYSHGMWLGIAIAGSKDAFIGIGNVLSTENNKNISKYNVSTNSWQKISDFPFANGGEKPIGFNLKGITYIRTSASKDFYHYDEVSDSWIKLQSDLSSDIEGGIAFSIGGKAYVGLGQTNAMWEYDPSR